MTIQKMKKEANPAEDSSAEVASMSFDRGGQAALVNSDPATQKEERVSYGGAQLQRLEIQIRGFGFLVNLATRPASIVLLDRSSEDVAARFLYSAHGIDPSKGQEVRSLDIYSGYGNDDDNSVEWILATYLIEYGTVLQVLP